MSRLPIANIRTTQIDTHFAKYFPNPFSSSLPNRGIVVNANNLFSRAAITAPANPIIRVKCDTIVCEAGILFNVGIIGRMISRMRRSVAGRITKPIKMIKEIPFSNCLYLFNSVRIGSPP